MSDLLSLDVCETSTPDFKRKILSDVIIDRGSRYTVVIWYIESKKDVSVCMKEILRDKYFRKSSHNSYGFRAKQENGSILESKSDDWESWAGNCILRELQRWQCVNVIIVVTRYFWWIQLHADRFKNVIDATKKWIETFKK